ncbi:MAG: anti-sigma factor [Ferruginibacter sp.]
MEKKDIISSGLLEMYVTNLCTEQENAQVELWKKQFPEVAAEIEAIESGLETYAMMNVVTPNASVKEKVLTGINTAFSSSITPTAKVVSISSFWKYAAAASIILFLGSAIVNVVYYNKYQTANKDYEAAVIEKNSAQDQLASLEESNKEMKNDMGVIQSKYSEPVSLHGQPDAPEAAAKIFWMKNTTGEVFIDPSNLPEPPSGMQYQFWGFVDGKPVDGGLIVFTKKGDKYRIQKMKTFGKAEAFAVTLETEGGHPQPEGKIYVMGKM